MASRTRCSAGCGQLRARRQLLRRGRDLGLRRRVDDQRPLATQKIGADAAIGSSRRRASRSACVDQPVPRFTRNFDAALFGNILGVTPQDLVAIAVVAVVTLVLVSFCTSSCCS